MAWDNLEKSGGTTGGWDYNEADLDYNQDTDVDTGSDVLYNSLGVSNTWDNLDKS